MTSRTSLAMPPTVIVAVVVLFPGISGNVVVPMLESHLDHCRTGPRIVPIFTFQAQGEDMMSPGGAYRPSAFAAATSAFANLSNEDLVRLRSLLAKRRSASFRPSAAVSVPASD